MIHRFKKVTDGLYRGSAPSPMDLVLLKSKYNIKKIISLDAEVGHHISPIAKKLKINQIIIPIDYRKISLINLLKFNLKKLLLQGGPTYIHCAAGKDRTGLVVALLQCKYLGKDPEEAIQEAKELGFGIGIDPNITHLYEKLIRRCKKENLKDNNDADIVSNEREYISDTRDSYLQESQQCSFAPFLSVTRQYPYDSVYIYINDQSPTRENYYKYKNPEIEVTEENVVPLVGIFNNDSGIRGVGPVEPSSGFIYD